jgi:PAS domain S-box-containing protein
MDLLEEFKKLKNKAGLISSGYAIEHDLMQAIEAFETILADQVKRNEEDCEKYKMLFDHAGESIFIHDAAGIIMEANRTAYTTYGYEEDVFKGLSVTDVDSPEESVHAPNRIEQLMKDGHIGFESIHQRKNGDHFPVVVTAKLIDWNGQKAVMSLCRDISERKKAEQALYESEIKFKKIVEESRDGIVIFESSGEILIWNTGAEEITGVKAEKAIGKKLYDVQYELINGSYKNKEFILQKFDEVVHFSSTEVFNEFSINEIFVEGKGLRYIQAYIFPVLIDKENRIFGTTIRDITEFKDVETQLTELNTTKDNFLSLLAHDLRSPFNSIMGFSKLVLDRIHTYTIEEVEEKIRMIYETTIKTHTLLEEILLWAKSQTGKLSFEPQKLRFIEIGEEVIESFRDRMDSKQITVQCFESEPTFLSADLNLFKTILRNLLSNAIKYSNIGGNIKLFSIKNDGFATITVSDNGVGIEELNIQKLWGIKEHFTTPGTAKEEGSGFGLLLCKEFVEKHGGTVWVESKQGEGSRFNFTIPLANGDF